MRANTGDWGMAPKVYVLEVVGVNLTYHVYPRAVDSQAWPCVRRACQIPTTTPRCSSHFDLLQRHDDSDSNRACWIGSGFFESAWGYDEARKGESHGSVNALP